MEILERLFGLTIAIPGAIVFIIIGAILTKIQITRKIGFFVINITILSFIIAIIMAIIPNEKRLFEEAQTQNSINSYIKFIAKYPESEFKGEALHQLEPMLWCETIQSDDEEGYNKYLKFIPNSKNSKRARIILKYIGKTSYFSRKSKNYAEKIKLKISEDDSIDGRKAGLDSFHNLYWFGSLKGLRQETTLKLDYVFYTDGGEDIQKLTFQLDNGYLSDGRFKYKEITAKEYNETQTGYE